MASIKSVAPADAARLLEGNSNNRALNKSAVYRYAAAMQRGEWRVGNDAICIGADGALLNGQHRLNAIVESGCTIELLFREGVEVADLKAMDQGNKRIGADIATLLGHKMTRAHSKALRLLGSNWALASTMATPSVDELIDLDKEWGPFLENASKLLSSSKRNFGIPVAVAAEALRWGHLDGRVQLISDFFAIMWDNTPQSDRPTDSKRGDFIPCQFHRYVNSLAREGKHLRRYQQYKFLVVGLHAYITGTQLTRASKLDVASILVPLTNPFRA